jgi:hypothetical protein
LVCPFFFESFLLEKKKYLFVFQGQALGEFMAQFVVNPTLLRVVRVARVGRILRLVKGLISYEYINYRRFEMFFFL